METLNTHLYLPAMKDEILWKPLIEKTKASITDLAELLFPTNKHPLRAFERCVVGHGEGLRDWQLIRLCDFLSIDNVDLYSHEGIARWVAPKGHSYIKLHGCIARFAHYEKITVFDLHTGRSSQIDSVVKLSDTYGQVLDKLEEVALQLEATRPQPIES